MKISEILSEGQVIPFIKSHITPKYTPISKDKLSEPSTEQDNVDNKHYDIDDEFFKSAGIEPWYTRYGPGDHILYNGRLAQIVKSSPGSFVIVFDDTRKKIIIGKKDPNIDLADMY